MTWKCWQSSVTLRTDHDHNTSLELHCYLKRFENKKRDHSVIFETAPKHCILDSFVDHEGYSISSKGFLITVVNIMVIWVKFAHSSPNISVHWFLKCRCSLLPSPVWPLPICLDPSLCQRSWNWPTRPSRTNTKKRCPFHHRGLECKSRSQEIPGVTGKFGVAVQYEAGQRQTVFC